MPLTFLKVPSARHKTRFKMCSRPWHCSRQTQQHQPHGLLESLQKQAVMHRFETHLLLFRPKSNPCPVQPASSQTDRRVLCILPHASCHVFLNPLPCQGWLSATRQLPMGARQDKTSSESDSDLASCDVTDLTPDLEHRCTCLQSSLPNAGVKPGQPTRHILPAF